MLVSVFSCVKHYTPETVLFLYTRRDLLKLKLSMKIPTTASELDVSYPEPKPEFK